MVRALAGAPVTQGGADDIFGVEGLNRPRRGKHSGLCHKASTGTVGRMLRPYSVVSEKKQERYGRNIRRMSELIPLLAPALLPHMCGRDFFRALSAFYDQQPTTDFGPQPARAQGTAPVRESESIPHAPDHRRSNLPGLRGQDTGTQAGQRCVRGVAILHRQKSLRGWRYLPLTASLPRERTRTITAVANDLPTIRPTSSAGSYRAARAGASA